MLNVLDLLLLLLLLPRGLFRVRFQMGVEHRFRGERLVADRARVRSVAGVTPQVYHEGGSLGETFLAVGTFVRPLTGVRAPVDAEIILRDESLAAEIAHVRFLAGVFTQMHGEIRLAGDGFPADGANVFVLRPGVPVSLHMDQQYLPPGESFVAQLAVVLPLRRHVVRLVKLRVQPKSLPVAERRVAYLALKLFIVVGMVHGLVLLVAAGCVEADAARLAFVLDGDLLISRQAFLVAHLHLLTLGLVL